MTNTKEITLNQPRGLYTLSFIELWERFGFYSVQALLVLFLTNAYHYPDAKAYDLFSAYSSLIYATPVIGGYLADKFLGFRKAIFFGGFLYLLGYMALASGNQSIFYIALALLICGNGFFKSCVSSLLGTLYEPNDPRRDSGFTIFYMGINIGVTLAPIVVTSAANTLGWGYGFAAAALGMVIALTVAYFGFKHLGKHGLPPENNRLVKKIFLGIKLEYFIFAGVLLFIGLISLLIQHSKLVDRTFEIFSLIVVILVTALTFREAQDERNKMLVMITLIVFSIFFWALYVQIFSSYALFIERVVDRHFLNWIVPPGYFLSLEGIFVILFSPVLALIWIKLAKINLNPSSPMKFGLGIFFMGISFLIVPLSILFANNGLVSMSWIIFSFILLTLGELFLSPTGLAMITALAPPNRTGMMMGVWFLSLAAAFSIGDYIEDLMAIPKGMTDIHQISHIYGHVYNILGWSAIGVSAILIAISPKLYKLIKQYE